MYSSLAQNNFIVRSAEASSIAPVNDNSATIINNKKRYNAPYTPRLFQAIHAKKRLIMAQAIKIKEYIVYCICIGFLKYFLIDLFLIVNRFISQEFNYSKQFYMLKSNNNLWKGNGFEAIQGEGNSIHIRDP